MVAAIVTTVLELISCIATSIQQTGLQYLTIVMVVVLLKPGPVVPKLASSYPDFDLLHVQSGL